jgi:F0F1-type ATP synthase assembly protein I
VIDPSDLGSAMLRPSDVAETARSYSQIYQLVSEFVIPIGLGIAVDWHFGTLPWGSILGTVCGVLLGSFRIRLILKKLEQQDRLNADSARNPKP